MADYISIFSGSQMDDADTLALNPDATPTLGSGNLVTSDGIARAVNAAQYSSAPAIVSTASGSVASFADGADGVPVRSLVAAIKAAQDLNGYANPWPAGGGKNKIDMADSTAGVTAFGLLSTVSGEYITFSGTCNSGGSHTWEFVELSVAQQPLAETLSFKGFIISGAAETAIGSISYNSGNGKLIINMTGLVTNQAYNIVIGIVGYTGDAPASWSPYSNVCPISGYTGANVTRAGRNMLNEASLAVYTNWSKDLFPYGSYPTNNNSRGIALPVKAGVTYTLSFGISGDGYPQYLYLIRGQGTTSERLKVFTNTNYVDDHFTFTADAGWLYYIRLGSMSTESNFNNNWANVAWSQMELGSTPTGHVSYAGEVFSVSWQDEAGTVYGGTLNVTTGVLTVTHGYKNGAALTWNYKSGSTDVFQTSDLAGVVQPPSANNVATSAISDSYQHATYSSIGGTTGYFGISTGGTVRLMDSAYDGDIDGFRAAMASVNFCYPLATPTTYQLTPQEVASLLGQNNVWNDVGGDTEVEYVADTALALAEILPDAPAADGAYTLTCTVSGGVATYSWA